MVPSPKRPRIEASIDPFEVFIQPLLQDLFLQHLTGKEVLSVFEVSKEWNEVLSGSSAAMSKIKLNVEERNTKLSRRNVTKILESNRRHLSLRCHFRFKGNIERKLLILDRFSQSLVDLSLESGDRVEGSKLFPNLHFPKLKKLKVSSNNIELIHKVLLAATSLEHFAFQDPQHAFFTRPVPAIATNISSLSFVSFEMDETERINFKNFVLDSKFLTTVKIEFCSREEIELIINELPNIQNVETHPLFAADWETLKLNTNRSIKSLKLDYFDSDHNFDDNTAPSIVRHLARSLVNLEVYEQFSANEAIFKEFLSSAKHLKKFSYASSLLDYADFEALYNDMKILDPSISQDLQIINKFHRLNSSNS